MKTIIVSLAFFMVTVNGHPHIQASGSVGEVKISWKDAAWAVERGDADVVPTFLANHQIDEEGTYLHGIQGVTMLEIAAYHGNVVAVQQLLQAQPGPNINHQDKLGRSALHLAVYEGHLEVTRMLLDADNIDINLQSNNGYTAYDNAVYSDYWYKDEIAKVIKTKATALGSSDYCNKTC